MTIDFSNLTEEQVELAVYKEERDCTADDRAIRLLELERCRRDFLRFTRYVKIVEAPTASNPGGVIAFELWPHIKMMMGAFLIELLISILKSRQIGASWTVADWVLWNALSKKADVSILYSKGEIEAIELLAKCRRIYNNLPDFMRIPVNPNSATEMGFPDMLSSIKVMAATETAGISFTASRVVCDEHEAHPYPDFNYNSAKPTIDAGGQFISIFTVDKTKPDSFAKSLFRGGLHESSPFFTKKNGFKSLFFPYNVRPRRDDQWYEKTKASIPERELALLSPELYMEQNYPCSIEEALRPTQTVSVFNLLVIDEMMADIHNPVRINDKDIDTEVVNVYKPFFLGESYIAATDTSHGMQKDFGVTVVLNVKTGEIVADIMSNLLPPEELAMHSVAMLGLYKNPLWFPESNDSGGLTIATAQRLGYKNFGYQDEKKQKIGFNMNSFRIKGQRTGTRIDLWGALIPAINNHQITIHNKVGLSQFMDIIRNSQKEGRIEAAGNRHDDYPIAVGIAWMKKDEVQTEKWESGSVSSLTFRKIGKLAYSRR